MPSFIAEQSWFPIHLLLSSFWFGKLVVVTTADCRGSIYVGKYNSIGEESEVW